MRVSRVFSFLFLLGLIVAIPLLSPSADARGRVPRSCPSACGGGVVGSNTCFYPVEAPAICDPSKPEYWSDAGRRKRGNVFENPCAPGPNWWFPKAWERANTVKAGRTLNK